MNPSLDRSALKRALSGGATAGLVRIGYSGAMAADAKREAWWWLRARAGAARRRSRLIRGRGIVWADSGRAEAVAIDVPRAGRGEVTIRVLASVVSSGTERAQYLQLPDARIEFPFTPGYSAAGIVIARGSDVSELDTGQLVAARGVPHASVATVPAADAVAVPDGVDVRAAATIALGVICRQGVRLAELGPGEPFCVLGAGPIGLLTQRLATAAGAGPATIVARSSAKAEYALRGGARFVALDEAEAPDESRVVIEATGNPSAFALAVAAAAPGGRIVLLGSTRGVVRLAPLAELREKQLTVIGAHVETLRYEQRGGGQDLVRQEARAYLDALAAGRLEVSDLVEMVVDPRDADAFYRRLSRDPEIAAAVFDWSSVPDSVAAAPVAALRPPAVAARGVDRYRRPARTRARLRERQTATLDEGCPLRVGLFGCGDIAVHNAAAVAAAPNAQLVGYFDPNASLADDLARVHGGRAMASAEALLERDDVDAVFLSVPHHLHAPLALQAIEAGKHVIVEKPLANTLAAAAEIVAAAERAGVTLSVCFPHRYEHRAVAARRLVDAGATGTFAGATVALFADKPPSYWHAGFSGRSTSDWRSSREKAGGGFLIMNLSHLVDLLLHLVGTEVETCAAVVQSSNAAAEVEDAVSLTLKFANGAIGTFLGSAAARGHRTPQTKFELWGDDGFLVVEPELRVYTSLQVDDLRPARWHVLETGANEAIRTDFVSRFASAVAQGRPPDITPGQALAVQALIESAYRSAETGTVISPSELLEEVRV